MKAVAFASLWFVTGLVAQDLSGFAPRALRVGDLAQAVADARHVGDEVRIEAASKELDAGVDALLSGELLTTRDYNGPATWVMNAGCPAVCQRIARFVIAKHEQPGQLREFLGIANMELARKANTDAEMRTLAAEAVAALEIWCDAKPKSMGPMHLMQAYAVVGEWGKAVAWDDRLAAQKSVLALPPSVRAMFLLGAEQWDKALELLLTPAVAAEQDAVDIAVLTSRAQALKGDVTTAIATATAYYDKDASVVAVEGLADVLAFAGKYDEALALLKKHPELTPSKDASLQAGRRKSRAVLAWLIALRGKRPADMRQRLGRLLEAKFEVVGLKEGQALAKTLADSPWALAYTARATPSGPAGWANDLLFAACVHDAGKYVVGAGEKALLAAIVDEPLRQALVGKESLARANRDACNNLVLADKPGVLVVRKLLRQP